MPTILNQFLNHITREEIIILYSALKIVSKHKNCAQKFIETNKQE